MNFGYLGVVIYLWAYHQLIRVYLPGGMGIPGVVRFLFHSAVWFNFRVNMSYTNIAVVIAYLLFFAP